MMSTPSSEGSKKNTKDLKEGEKSPPQGVFWTQLAQVKIDSNTAPEGPDKSVVAKWLTQALHKHALFAPAPSPKSPQATFQVSYSTRLKPHPTKEGTTLGSVSVQATLRLSRAQRKTLASSGHRGRWKTDAFVTESLPKTMSPKKGLETLTKGVMEEVARDLYWQAHIHTSDTETLRSLLRPTQPEARIELALQEARLRSLREVAPDVVKLLDHKDRNLVNLAASALGVLGDRKMVGKLIQVGSRVDPIDRLPVIFALGELGGPVAEGYLNTLASSEELPPGVREAANDALRRVRENQ